MPEANEQCPTMLCQLSSIQTYNLFFCMFTCILHNHQVYYTLTTYKQAYNYLLILQNVKFKTKFGCHI